MYVTCGCRGVSYLRETLCYDPTADTWAKCADGPVERAWHGMAALNGRAYVIGGSNHDGVIRRDVLEVTACCCHAAMTSGDISVFEKLFIETPTQTLE